MINIDKQKVAKRVSRHAETKYSHYFGLSYGQEQYLLVYAAQCNYYQTNQSFLYKP